MLQPCFRWSSLGQASSLRPGQCSLQHGEDGSAVSNAPSVYNGRAPPSFPMHPGSSDAVLHWQPAVLLGEQPTEEDDTEDASVLRLAA